ncbi:delta-like protein C [Liolophura sinensis]|uniref:delta-like protein C n=1 Tax=Liolophura sinensis TaxID=3198878 RepID=UPI00315820F0
MGSHRKQISGLLFFMILITRAFGQLCGNCVNVDTCDKETGVCFGGCNLGWDGPTCSRRNVALAQSTRQSSDYSEKGFRFISRLAVDGRTGYEFYNKPYTCSHTGKNPQPASWTVTLNSQYNIYKFRIYNRKCDKCSGRLNGFSLSVGNSSKNYKACYQDTTTDPKGPGDIIDEVCNLSGPVLGDTVNIMISNSPFLSLCEVQIFVCTPGTYGSACGNRCGQCAEGPSACNTLSGLCPEKTPRCMPGYSGRKCDAECTRGTYGPDCEGNCGFCAQGSATCNTTSGHCPDREPRCALGYSDLKCATVSSVTSPDYTRVIVGCTVGIFLILVIVIIFIVLMVRRSRQNVQIGGATSSGPNSTPAQESSFSPEVRGKNEMSEPSSRDESHEKNSSNDHAYEVIRQNSSAI